jgi:hypothetical protein
VPAELDRTAEDVLGAVAARHELRAEADAEHRLVGLAESARERRLARQIGVVGIVERALRAAEKNERIEAVRRIRHALALVGTHRAPLGAGRVERLAHQPERRLRIVLDHQDAHVFPAPQPAGL